jgi:membrane protein DedA with SNARE-associated domain
LEDFLRSWGYLGVFVGILLTGIGFPMPEELPIVIGGALAGGSTAYWWLMLPVCIVGVVIGDSFLYAIGRLWGPRLVDKPFVKKHLLPPDRLQKIEQNFHDYGIRILLFARITPGIRAPIFFTAGLVRLPLVRFIIADGIYAVPGVTLLFFLGYWFTERMVALIQDDLEKAKSIIVIGLILAFVLYVTYKMFRRGPVVTGSPEEAQDLPLLSKVTMIMEPSADLLDRAPAASGDGSASASADSAPPASTDGSPATESPTSADAKLPADPADASKD